jgi:hypothetical protein
MSTLFSLCGKRPVEVFESRKRNVQTRLCGPCYHLQSAEQREREDVARMLRKDGRTFQEVFGVDP